MIARYARAAMADLWSDAARYRRWLAVEVAALKAQEAHGLCPAGTAERVARTATFDVARIDALEATLHHDVLAFLTDVGASLGEEKRFVHQGMTSSDLVDSAQGMAIVEAGALLDAGIARLETVTRALAERHRNTLTVGRTHGVHAEPTTFGLKVLGWATAFRRSRDGLRAAVRECAVGKLSGAVGQAAHLPLAVEEDFARALGLVAEPIATQVVARDRYATLFAALAHLAANLERVATEIRHLQRTEVREVEEPFGAGQKGSSAMPHKRNPVVCERITGLARLFRGYAVAAYEDVALWHERDISHSSVERVILPDGFALADYLVDRMAWVLEGLTVDAARMRTNLESTGGLVHSQRVLLALTGAGMTREEAYAIVQRHAMTAWRGEGRFADLLAAEPAVRERLGSTLAACFDDAFYLARVDALFERADRVLGATALLAP